MSSGGKVVEDEVKLNMMMLPAGFRFKPTDEVLLLDYLKPKVMNQMLPPNMINSVDLYKYNPINLTETFKKRKDDDEWYFFTTTTRTSQTTGRTSRTTPDGYWLATQGDKQITLTRGPADHQENSKKRKTTADEDIIGYKKMLVYYFNKENKPEGSRKTTSRKDAGVKTDWIMYEYVLLCDKEHEGGDVSSKKRHELVLCQIHNNRKTPAPSVPMNASSPPKFSSPITRETEVEAASVHHQQNGYLQEESAVSPMISTSAPLAFSSPEPAPAHHQQEEYYIPVQYQQEEYLQVQQQQEEYLPVQQQQDEYYFPVQKQQEEYRPVQQQQEEYLPAYHQQQEYYHPVQDQQEEYLQEDDHIYVQEWSVSRDDFNLDDLFVDSEED